MDKRIDFFALFKNEGKIATLQVYPAKSSLVDSFEGNSTLTYMNPIPVKGLIRQVGFEALHWKYYGEIPVGSIELITCTKNLTLLKTAGKIKYGDNYFKTWESDAKGFAILERPDYIIVVLAQKVI